MARVLLPVVLGRPDSSVWNDPTLHLALTNSLRLAALTMLIATPLGVALALGLTRWRGRTATASNALMLLPLATPEIVMGSALYLVFTISTRRPARPASAAARPRDVLRLVRRGHRARPAAHDRPEYEEAAQDLGAAPVQAIRTILLPLLAPAVFASLLVVFAASIDDFVISAFLSATPRR